MRRHFVSGFPRALLSLSQEKSSGVEIVTEELKVHQKLLLISTMKKNGTFCSRKNETNAKELLSDKGLF